MPLVVTDNTIYLVKKILYVTPKNPWDNKYGGAIRNNHIIKGLCKYYDVHVALTSTNMFERESFINLAPLDRVKLHLLNEASSNTSNKKTPVHLYYLAGLLGYGRFNESLFEIMRVLDPDLVWYFQKHSLRSAGFPDKTPFILDLDNVNWNLLKRTAQYQSGKHKFLTSIKMYLSYFEERILVRRASLTVISNPDEQNKLPTHNKVTAIDNGFNFSKDLEVNKARNQRILFFGSLFYYPNLDGLLWFCDKIWPIILTRRPESKLDIVGHVNDMKDIEGVVKLPGIRFHGFVEDIDPFIKTNACLVVPLRIASGTRVKILESWAKGLPVVSTTLGAEGLGASNHHSILTGDTPDEFADASLRILNDPKLGTQLAKNAFLYSKDKYNWDSIYSKIKLAVQSL